MNAVAQTSFPGCDDGRPRVGQIPAEADRLSTVVPLGTLQHAYARIQELELQLETMTALAHEDRLTGLLNRRGLEALFARELARAARGGSPLCVVALDLDDFKCVNDCFGHHGGDLALVHFARTVNSGLRKTDIFARLGGEEFLIVLPDTPLERAIDVSDRLRKTVAGSTLRLGESALMLTFSAGIAAYRHGEDESSLMQRADAGAYRAKRNGKNCIAAESL